MYVPNSTQYNMCTCKTLEHKFYFSKMHTLTSNPAAKHPTQLVDCYKHTRKIVIVLVATKQAFTSALH